MQVMNTPKDLAESLYQPNDYPYSGELFVTHSLHSYNAVKRYDFQTEVSAGIIGPLASTRQTQTIVHRAINNQRPMGWGNQFKNDLLLNISFTAEKQLISHTNFLEIIGGSQVSAGTMFDGANVYGLVRVGCLKPYFQGLIGQCTCNDNNIDKRRIIHANLFMKPGIQYVLRNALLQGGLFTQHPMAKNEESGKQVREQYYPINNVVPYVSYGIVVNYGNLSLTYSQTTSAAVMSNLYSHSNGNISICYSW